MAVPEALSGPEIVSPGLEGVGGRFKHTPRQGVCELHHRRDLGGLLDRLQLPVALLQDSQEEHAISSPTWGGSSGVPEEGKGVQKATSSAPSTQPGSPRLRL